MADILQRSKDLRRERLALALIVVAGTGLYAAGALRRYSDFGGGVDLTIFAQAVWHYSHFQVPFSTIKGEDILGDHFHPIVALLAILYWIWSNPEMLLLAQAGLVAASGVPVFLFARDRLPGPAALAAALAYVAFWGLQVGVAFDFHEVAFAPLLIAGALLALDRGHVARCWVAVGLLLLVKEDMSFVVVFIGLMWLLRRRYGHGVAMMIVAITFYEVVTRVVIPHFAATHSFGYWSYGQFGANPLAAIWGILTAPWKLITVGLAPSTKAHTLLLLFLPFLFLSLASPLILVAIPLLAERFLSTTAAYWSTQYHYSLAVSPVLAMAAVDGLARLVALWRRRWPEQGRHARFVVGLPVAIMLVLNLGLSGFSVANTAQAIVEGRTGSLPGAEIRALDGAVAHVPSGVSLAAPSNVGGHLADRPDIQELTGDGIAQSQYLVADMTAPSCCSESSPGAVIGAVIDSALSQFTPVYYADGWLVARRAKSGIGSAGVLTRLTPAPSALLRAAEVRWATAVAQAALHIETCAASAHRHAADLSCYVVSPVELETRYGALAATVSRAARSLRGGCGQLADTADRAAARLSAELEAVGSAAENHSATALGRAYGDLAEGQEGADQSGVVERFVILCTSGAAKAAASTVTGAAALAGASATSGRPS